MITIRPAIPADALAIAAVHNASREATYPEFLDGGQFERLDDAARAVRWEKILGDGITTTLVAEESNAARSEPGPRVVGFVTYGPDRAPEFTDAAEAASEIRSIYVHPSACRHGVGRALMTAALGELAAAGRTCVTLWVVETNARAQEFYRALGFAPDGARELTGLDKTVPICHWRRIESGLRS